MNQNMVRFYTVFVAIFLLLSVPPDLVFGQNKNIIEGKVDKVKELIDNDMFVSALAELDNIDNLIDSDNSILRSEVEIYKLICKIKLERPNLDPLMIECEKKYSNSPEFATAKFYYSQYYFKNSNYSKSLEIMNSIGDRNLLRKDKIEYIYNKSYCYMRIGKNEEAVSGFNKILSFGATPFSSSSIYYLGYLHYMNREFDNAISYFKKLLNNDRYSSLSKYYLLESKLMKGDNDYVVNNGDGVLRVVDISLREKVARMISEAYFAKNDPEKAKKYFDIFSKNKEDLSKKDNYYLGIVSYSLKSYLAAIEAFSKVTSSDDSLGQSAFFYIGNSYLYLKNKHNAMDAFKAASEMVFDETITSESMFQYAKLSFDINSDIEGFQTYLQKYPSSIKSDEIYNYIATSYLLKKDYKSAITALQQIRSLTPAMRINLQKAAFFRAMQLFESGSYRGAITHFNLSIDNGVNNTSLALLAKFWLAESYFRTNLFQESIDLNLSLYKNNNFRMTSEYPTLLFNLGYGYLRINDYNNSIMWMKRYLELSPSQRRLSSEAKTRLADSYYMIRDYERAAELYNEVAALNNNSSDIYASYQSAVSYGLISKDSKKIEILNNIYSKGSNSPLYPKAVFELGRTYVQIGDIDRSFECFNYLLKNVKDSVYYSKSLLELGMIFSNKGDYDKSLEYFSAVVESTKITEDLQSALAGIESIYQLQNRPEEYLAYLERIGMSSVKSATEREMMLFNSAEQIFLSKNFVEANRVLSSFVKKYPKGVKSAQAYFYLGETLLNMNKKEAAADAFHKVMLIGDESFEELSTLYYAKLSYDLEKYDKAIKAYEALLYIAKLENNIKEAKLGLMRSYFKNKSYEAAYNQSKELLMSEKADNEYTIEFKYVMAKSSLSLGRREEAISLLQDVSKNNLTDYGAEAAYLLILDAYDEGMFELVKKRVYELSDSKTPNSYWLAKSFIVLGDSFAEQGEFDQAKATFTSIKEGYEPSSKLDDILEQVDMRLHRLSKTTLK